jgi:O-antigen ligase
MLWSVVAVFASGVNLTEGFFGVTGRQTGLLAYLALVVLMSASVLTSNSAASKRLALALVLLGTASGFYGVIQALGADPFDWINPYSPVFGFFGNPNFQASFMGMAAVGTVALIFDKKMNMLNRFGLFIFVLLSIFNIYKSKSQQGYLVFLAGIVVIGYLLVRSHLKLQKLTPLYVVATIVGFIAVILDILQKAPWNSILYKDSVSYRGDFWRAGWRMTMDHPIFGVGFDGYRDHYRTSRDLVTALRPGSDALTDSAHNVFLDISSAGGFPLLATYIFLVGLTVVAAIKVIRRNKEFDVAFASILAVWVAYLAQSIISINQLGLAVWGWVLMGSIIGYEINTREKTEIIKVKSTYATAAISLGLILGLSIGIPLMVADATFRSTVKSGDVLKIEASIRQWPQSVTRMTYVAEILREGKLPERSIVIAREAVKFNPMNYEAWRELSLQPNASKEERDEAIMTMKKLDPYNPNLK